MKGKRSGFVSANSREVARYERTRPRFSREDRRRRISVRMRTTGGDDGIRTRDRGFADWNEKAGSSEACSIRSAGVRLPPSAMGTKLSALKGAREEPTYEQG